MNSIQYYPITVATTTTSTSVINVDKYDQLQVYVPAVASIFGSGVVAITLKGKPSLGNTSLNMNYFDYVNKTPATSVITISTGGVYEMPYPGATNYVSLQFDVATTNTTQIILMAPKTTY
jgi:hypothetical protein